MDTLLEVWCAACGDQTDPEFPASQPSNPEGACGISEPQFSHWEEVKETPYAELR